MEQIRNICSTPSIHQCYTEIYEHFPLLTSRSSPKALCQRCVRALPPWQSTIWRAAASSLRSAKRTTSRWLQASFPLIRIWLTAPTYRLPAVGYGDNAGMEAINRRKKRAAEAALSVKAAKTRLFAQHEDGCRTPRNCECSCLRVKRSSLHHDIRRSGQHWVQFQPHPD